LKITGIWLRFAKLFQWHCHLGIILPSFAHGPQGTFSPGRRSFIGGSDARIIMGNDGDRLYRLWKEKRGEVEPEDLSGELIVQLGTVTEQLNRHWYERNTGHLVVDVQRRAFHKIHKWMAATLDGKVTETGAVFKAKFMLPWNFSEEAAAEKHMAQLQHNMWVVDSRTAVLSIITGGGKWVEITIPADPLYQHLLLTAERKFWRCVETGELPQSKKRAAEHWPHDGRRQKEITTKCCPSWAYGRNGYRGPRGRRGLCRL
jgi:predicted phage-related endonuclease